MELSRDYLTVWHLSPASVVTDVPLEKFVDLGYGVAHKIDVVLFKVEAVTFPVDTSIPSGQRKIWNVAGNTWEDDGTGTFFYLDANNGERLWARIVFYHNGVEWTWNDELIDQNATEVEISFTYENI